MSRSIWAAAGASMFAFALTPGAALAAGGGSSAARPASAHAKQNTHPRRRAEAIRRLRHSAARADAPRRAAVLLAPGSGYQQAAGSGRVRVLQRRLAGSGFAPGPIDGRYGPLTEQAVRRFQAAHGLQVDGIAGPRTLAARSTPTEVLFPTSGYDSPGGSAPVRALQRRLARAGDPPGPIDGRYGPLTERAVIRFQAANGLQVDGIAGPRTLARVSPKGSPRRQLHHRPRPRHSRPTVAHHRPTAAPAPATAHHARHSAGSSSTPWLILVAGSLLALLASVSQYARRRRSASPGTEDLNDGTVAVSSMDLGAAELLGPAPAFQRADHRGDPHGAFSLGVALEQRGDLAGAAAAYRRADQRGHGAAACNLGVLLEEQGELADAERAFQRADHRGDPHGAFNLGVLLEQSGNLAGALTAFRRAGERGSPEVGERVNAALLELARDSDSPGTDQNGGGHDGR
jgi:peptidoglycan hydrolase-like protein with peptidoglycan-binding domain